MMLGMIVEGDVVPRKNIRDGRACRMQRLISDRPLTGPRPLREMRVVAVAAGDAVDPHETVGKWMTNVGRGIDPHGMSGRGAG
jgi:hypothetical protein